MSALYLFQTLDTDAAILYHISSTAEALVCLSAILDICCFKVLSDHEKEAHIAIVLGGKRTMQQVSVLILLVIFFLYGVFLILFNLRSSKMAEQVEMGEREFYRSYGALWRRRIFSWHVVDRENENPAVLKEVITSWEIIQAPQRIAFGLTMSLYALAYFLWLVLSKGAIFNNVSLLLILWIAYVLSLFLGTGLGYVIGFRRAKQEIRHAVAYADLRQRSLSDYRSDLLRGLLGLAVITQVVLFLILPSFLAQAPFLPHNAWLIAISVGVIYLLGESFLSYIAVLPRLVVTPNPIVAQHADDLLRALIIDDIHVRMLIGIGFLLGFQWFFLSRWIAFSSLFMALFIVMTCLWFLCLFPTIWRASDKGHLGGKVTGWPWSKKVVE